MTSSKHGSPQFTLRRAGEAGKHYVQRAGEFCRDGFDPYQLTTPEEAQQEKTVVGMGSTNRMRARRRKEGLDRGLGTGTKDNLVTRADS